MAKTRTALKMDKEVDEVVDEATNIYFANVNKEGIDFIHSGCRLLDCVLGGGWPFGRISNIVGDRSSGKCVKNAYILGPSIGMSKIDTIGEQRTDGTTEWYHELCQSKNKNAISTHFYKEQVEKTIKITTRHGYSIECTPNHPLMVWMPDCSTKMITASELSEQDVMVIAKGTATFSDTYVETKPYIESLRTESIHCTNVKEVHFPEFVTPDLGELLGYLVADGNLTTNGIFLANPGEREWLTLKTNSILKDFGLQLSKTHIICSSRFTDFIRAIVSNGHPFTARFKEVPKAILESPEDVQIAFLRGLINCDGWYNGQGHLDYYTASEMLANQIHLMLLNLGIVGNLNYKQGADIGDVHYDHTYWSISIYGKYVNLYAKKIGSSPGRYFFKDAYEKGKSQFDSIPYLKEKMLADRDFIKDTLGWSRNGKLANGTRMNPFKSNSTKAASWHLLDLFINAHSDYKKIQGFELEFYENLKEKGYHFDPIVEIKKIQSPTYVYDVHVPNSHLFWCNGFVSHNTLLCMEACANAHMQYPDMPIYYMEAESAFDEDYATALGIPIEAITFIDNEDNTVESLFEVLEDEILPEHIKTGEKGLFIVDSLDALSDRAEMKRNIDDATFGGNKAKQLSAIFRRLTSKIGDSNVHLMIISQVRDNIGVSFGPKYTRAGGKALDFYASQILWLAEKKKHKKTISKIERPVGVQVVANCKKNKVGLPFRTCEFPIYFGYGMDDFIAHLEFLNAANHLHKIQHILDLGKNPITSKTTTLTKMSSFIRELKGILSREEINKLREELNEIVVDTWQEIETGFLPKHSKY